MSDLIVQELPFHADSEVLFARFRHLPGAVWLDSGKPRALQGRFDLISALPDLNLTTTAGITLRQCRDEPDQQLDGDPFALAWRELAQRGLFGREHSHIPFCGGLIGYVSYDLGERRLGVRRAAPHPGSEMHLGWYGWGIITNHQASTRWLVIHPRCHPDTAALVRQRLAADAPEDLDAPFQLHGPFVADITKDHYLAAIHRIQDYILGGDCYQANFAFSHRAPYSGDTWQAYRTLRRLSPAPYGAYLRDAERDILCFSPERFLKVSVGQVETKPIKGTLPRGKTLAEDQDNAVRLLNSAKDRAENLMIVDLLRNDLGINCTTGSVRVPKLFALESFANVHHLVSTVTGALAADRTPLDLLRDAFPGGSITGAPKKRAMEIIAELETGSRGIYCGSIGYISANGRMDTNIAIRTLEARNGELICWGGGGIVADSVPELEYQEVLHKVGNLMHGLTADSPIN